MNLAEKYIKPEILRLAGELIEEGCNDATALELYDALEDYLNEVSTYSAPAKEACELAPITKPTRKVYRPRISDECRECFGHYMLDHCMAQSEQATLKDDGVLVTPDDIGVDHETLFRLAQGFNQGKFRHDNIPYGRLRYRQQTLGVRCLIKRNDA